MKVSVVISAYNEEENINDCLKSVKDIADEIVVVDNSSSDTTKERALKFTDKVFSQENDPKNIDGQKNLGFSKAKGEWIFSLDADERITPELTTEIKSTLKNVAPDVNGYWVPRKNIIFGRIITSEMWSPDYQLRLFRKDKGEYSKGNVHKVLNVEGKTEKLENALIHHNYGSVSQFVMKLNAYTDAEAEHLSKEGYKLSHLDAIRFPVDDFVKTFFLQKGFKDGLHGLVLSMLQAFYMEVVFAKLWEKDGFREVNGKEFLGEVIREIRKSASKFGFWITSSLINETKNPVKKIGLKILRKTRGK